MPRMSNAKAAFAIARGAPFDNHSSTLGGRSTFIGWGAVPPEHVGRGLSNVATRVQDLRMYNP
jgi:hypothetical protein